MIRLATVVVALLVLAPALAAGAGPAAPGQITSAVHTTLEVALTRVTARATLPHDAT